MKIVRKELHLLFTPTKITIKYLIHHILNTTLSKLSLNVSYTFIHGFFRHQLFRPSLNTTFRPTYKKHETSKRLCSSCSKQDKRHYLASQNNFEQDYFSLKKLRGSNLNIGNQLMPKVQRKEALERVSFLITFEANNSSYNRQSSTIRLKGEGNSLIRGFLEDFYFPSVFIVIQCLKSDFFLGKVSVSSIQSLGIKSIVSLLFLYMFVSSKIQFPAQCYRGNQTWLYASTKVSNK